MRAKALKTANFGLLIAVIGLIWALMRAHRQLSARAIEVRRLNQALEAQSRDFATLMQTKGGTYDARPARSR